MPLHIAPSVTDVHSFQSFAVPGRALTRQEREVYRSLAADWAVLDASAQRELYALLLAGRLTDCVSEIFVNTTTAVLTREEAISNPRVREVACEFDKLLLQEHAGHLLGLHRTTGASFADVLSRDLTPKEEPVRPNFWQRLLGRGPDG
jgi:hypothetical protein